MTVGNDLSCLFPRACKAHAVDEIVQSGFQHDEQVGTCDTLFLDSLDVSVVELLLAQTVHVSQFLFFCLLQTVVGLFDPSGRGTVHSRDVRSLCQFFTGLEDREVQTSGDSPSRTCVSCHKFSPP